MDNTSRYMDKLIELFQTDKKEYRKFLKVLKRVSVDIIKLDFELEVKVHEIKTKNENK